MLARSHLHDHGQQLLHAGLPVAHGPQALKKEGVHLLVQVAQHPRMVGIGRHTAQSEEDEGFEGADVLILRPQPQGLAGGGAVRPGGPGAQGVDPAGQGRYAHPVEADIGHGGKQAFQHNAPLLVAGSLAGQVQGQADQCPGEVILGVGDGSGLAADACPAGAACAPGRLFTLEAKHFICH